MSRKSKYSTYFAEDYSLTIYLKELSKTKTLTNEEEIELTKRIQEGDEAAVHKLIKANLRFVVSVARNYQNQGLPLSDLINEGNIGLLRAAKRFDPNREYKFISYAVWWIRQAILQALAEHSRIVKLPLNKVGLIHKVGKKVSELEQDLGRTPLRGEIAEEMGLEEDLVDDVVKIGTNHVSLDAPVGSDDDSSSLIDLVRDNNFLTPEETFMKKKLREDIEAVLDTLSKREAEVIKMYYGIGYDIPYTLDEIGAKFNLTRERVRQIKEKALKKLKTTIRSERLREYLGKV